MEVCSNLLYTSPSITLGKWDKGTLGLIGGKMIKKTPIFKNLIWIMREVWNVSKLYWIVTVISIFITGVLPAVTTLLLQLVLNSIQNQRAWRTVVCYAAWYFSIDLLSVLCSYGIKYYKVRFNLSFSLILNEKILQKASRLSLKNYENSETYDQISMAQSQGNSKIMLYLEHLFTIISQIIGMISFLIILFSFNPGLVLCIIFLPIIKFIISKNINIISFNIIKSRMNDVRKANYVKYLLTYGDFYKELKIYNLSQHFIKKYRKYTQTFNEQDIAVEKKRIKWFSVISILETGIDSLLFIYIIYNGYIGKILIGNIMTYMKAILQIKTQMTTVLEVFSTMNQESLFLDQLREFFDLPETEQKVGKKISDIKEISIKNLYYRYHEDQEYVLKNINLQINFPETVAIVGENGSGKTTLIKLLMGFYDDYQGTIKINGIDLRELDINDYRVCIATIFQDYIKYEATFRENVAYGNLRIQNDDKKIKDILKKFGLSDLINLSNKNIDTQIGYWFDEGKQISLGQWQKIALSRAFAKEADLYFLDEPNAALDPLSERKIAQMYLKLLENKIGIIIAHKFNNFCKDMDKIVVIKDGEIVECGTHDILMKEGQLYRKLYEVQTGLEK